MDIDKMNAGQLKAYIIEKKDKLKKSQRKYVERRKAEGHYRVNAFITPEAAAVLKRIKGETKKSVGDILSELLCVSPLIRHKKNISGELVVKRTIPTKISGERKAKSSSSAEKRIGELAAQGMGAADVAKKLEEEGIRTAAGLKKWRRGTVHRIMKRLAQE